MILTEQAIQQVLPTATGFSAKQAVIVLRKRNVDPEPLLQRVGLSERNLENRQLRIPAVAQSKFLELAAETLGDSAFGLHLVEQANPREAGLSFYVASAGKNVGEALALFERYCRIVNQIMRVRLTPIREGLGVEVHYGGGPRQQARQITELGVAGVVKGLREVTGRRISPMQVTFVHGRNSNVREFERFFGCPVEFGAPANQFALSDEMLALRLITEDSHLLEMLRPVCDAAARERNASTGPLRGSVESEVEKLLPRGKVQRQTVARTLAMSARTLARRLADEGTSYEEVVDEVRRSLALQYVKERGISVSQIAWLLGYEGASSFNHAFRRWTGSSPSTVRDRRSLPASA
jgi:AraC-like DNA-binding protein